MVGGKEGLYLVSCRDFFWGIYLAGMVSYSKEVINGWDHLMHAIELGSEVKRYTTGTNKREFCREMGSGTTDIN